MVKHENFKTCSQSGFCARNRAYADAATAKASQWSSPYALDAASLSFKDGQLTGTLLKIADSKTGEKIKLPLIVSFLQSGTARVTVDEEKRQTGDITLRHNSRARKERYNEVEKWSIVGGLEPSTGAALASDASAGTTKVHYGPAGAFEAIITHEPFGIEFKRDGSTHVKFNGRGLLNMEHWRPKVEQEEKKEPEEGEAAAENKDETEDQSTWWEESFGGNTDTKPRGPESVALDIEFPGYSHVFGIPEHASSLSLKETRYATHPYMMTPLLNLANTTIVVARVPTLSLTGCTMPMFSSMSLTAL